MILQEATQSLSATNVRNIDATHTLASASLKAAERLMALNFDYARVSIDLAADNVRPAGSGDWPAIASQRSLTLRQATENTAAWLRGFYVLSCETQGELAELVSSRAKDVSESMNSMLGKLAQSGPAGSGGAAEMFNSVMAASRSIFNQVINTTQQMTAASIAAAGQPIQSTADVSGQVARAERKKAA